MKQLLFSIFFVLISVIVFAQPNVEVAKDTTNTIRSQKFNFPSSLFDDSVALIKAMPHLAEQVITGLSEKDKKNYEKTIHYYLLAQDYKKAMAVVDSQQKKDDDRSVLIEIKSYSIAKIKEKTQGASFDQVFKQDFLTSFNQLSFRKKVAVGFFDSIALNQLRTDYTDLADKLKKNKSDSLSFEDAQSLLEKFGPYSVYNKIIPLMSAVNNDPQYHQMFPAIKGYKWAGVVPVQGIDDRPDPNMKYKLLMELTGFPDKEKDPKAIKEIDGGLGEIARKINLHVAAGVPKKNIDVVIIVHAGALFTLLTNEKYKKKFDVDNPNIALLKELQGFGAKIIVCGQAMTFLRLEREDMVPGIKQALSAQTVLSTYKSKNYIHYNL